MVTMIACAILETLVKHITQKAIDKYESVDIDGAPSWYMRPVDDQMCVFTHAMGDTDSIEIAKNGAKYKMVKKINNLIEITIYDTKGLIKTNKDKKIVEKFKIDPNLNFFVTKNLNYSKIKYDRTKKESFVKACIMNKIIEKYQKNRLDKISKEIIKTRANDAFNELENSIKLHN